MEIRELPVDELVVDPNLNLRDRLDAETVERYAEAWDRMPPVTVFEVDDQWLLADGFHRHAAAVTLRKRQIPAELRTGTYDDALDYAALVNLRHGLPLTRNERRRAVEVKLRLHGDRSDRRLAEEMGVGRELIARVRKQLIESGQITAADTRVGADGKVYPSVGSYGKDPNERLPRGAAGEDEPQGPRKKRGEAPWDDTVDPLPPISQGNPPGAGGLTPPWEDGGAKAFAQSPPVPVTTPTIDEMLLLMARQLRELIAWTETDGFLEAYRASSQGSRGELLGAIREMVARFQELERAA